MAHIRHRVTLSEEETRILEDILDRGKHSAQKRKRARVMLLAHQGMTDPENAAISGIREQFCQLDKNVQEKCVHSVPGCGVTTSAENCLYEEQ